jgi:hypothetical protein
VCHYDHDGMWIIHHNDPPQRSFAPLAAAVTA